ncbi:MAG TPA: AAA family ATPase [Fervidobacterium sp.]|nr:AAA family ATPase [Fervidobacterium sp.]
MLNINTMLFNVRLTEKRWRTSYGSLISIVITLNLTFLLALSLFGTGPWHQKVGLILALVITALAYYSPGISIFMSMFALSVILLFTSPWLALINLCFYLVYLLLFSGQKTEGVMVLVILSIPFCLQYELYFLPLTVAVIVLSNHSYFSTSLFLGSYLGFWASLMGRVPGFQLLIKLGEPYYIVDLSSWINEIIGKYSATSVMVLEPWFKANLVIYLSFILIICLIGYATSKIRDYPFASGKMTGRLFAVLMNFVVTIIGLTVLAWLFDDIGLAASWIFPNGLYTILLALLLTRYLQTPVNLPKEIKELVTHSTNSGWNQIAGYEDVKKEIQLAILPYTNLKTREQMKRAKLPLTKGILLYGPPGVGKTLFARVIAQESKMAFISVAGSSFFSMWLGESERKLREIFEEATTKKPCLIFFDELESFLNPRDQAKESYAQRVVSTFLAQMDGFNRLDDILVIGATNYPNLIDPAAMRPGRFDKIIFIPPPDKEARRAIWEHYLTDRPVEGLISYDQLVDQTDRYTAADIEFIVNEAYRQTEGKTIKMKHLLNQISCNKPTITLEMLEAYENLSLKYDRRSYSSEKKEIREKKKYSWSDFAGMNPVKEELKKIVELPLTQPKLFETYKIKPSIGAIMHGPPGCGKTLLAKILADECDATFLDVKGPELLQSNLGESERKVRDLFRQARENKPSIIFFDEIDAIAQVRGFHAHQVVNQMLVEMDGMEELSGVFVLAATNRPDILDLALFAYSTEIDHLFRK